MIINEDIYDKHVSQLVKFLAPIDWKTLFYSFGDIDSKLQINWERITRKQISIFNVEDRYDKTIDKFLKDYSGSNLYVFLKDNDIFAVIFGDKFVVGKDGKCLKKCSAEAVNRAKEVGLGVEMTVRWDKVSERKKTLDAVARRSDEVWVIELEELIKDTRDLRKLREKSKAGVWENTPEFYAKWIKDNLARFEVKLKELKSKKVVVDNHYAKQIADFSKNVMDVYNELMVNGEKYDYNQDIERSVRSLRYCIQNLSAEYDDFMRYTIELKRDEKAGNKYGVRIASDSVNTCIKDLTSAIEKANADLTAVKNKMQAYLASKR